MTVRGGWGHFNIAGKEPFFGRANFKACPPPSIVDAVPMVIFVGGELTPALRNSTRRIAIGGRQ